MIPIWFIVIMTLAFTYLFVEMRIFVRAWNGQVTKSTAQLPVTGQVETPYHWKAAEQKEQCLILCQGCYLTCKRDKERWTAWKLPARTIRAWGSTLNFTEGCNVQRASLLKAMAREHRRKSFTPQQAPLPKVVYTVRTGSHREECGMPGGARYTRIVEDYKTKFHDCLCGKEWLEAHHQDEYPEPIIDISVDGKAFSANGDYKKGSIKQFVKANK